MSAPRRARGPSGTPLPPARPVIIRGRNTPDSFWTYKAPPPPSYEEAVRLGAINPDTMTPEGWESLTPGYRRTIVREHQKKKAGA